MTVVFLSLRKAPRADIMPDSGAGMRFFLVILTLIAAAPAFAEDVVLLNGTIIDGTLKARYTGNIRIRDGEIADIGAFKPQPGETVLDVKGLVVAPGFLDLHSQSAVDFAKDPGAVSQITQGITTVVTGGDGNGPYSIEEFLSPFDEKPAALNIAGFIGHSTVRRQIMGTGYKRAATADEIERMSELVKDGMLQGAFGFSSDLTREPSSYSTGEEIMALARAVFRYGGAYVIFPRNDSIKEAVEIGRTQKMPVHVSLAKPSTSVLGEIDKARKQGADIAVDVYSYTEAGPELRAFLQNDWGLILPAQFGRDGKAITLERAVRKMTGLPASRIGLRGRGLLTKGAPADIVVFNPLQIQAMKYVFVNGTMVVKDGEPTGAYPGQALR